MSWGESMNNVFGELRGCWCEWIMGGGERGAEKDEAGA